MAHICGKHWTEKEIKQSILEVMKQTGIKTMPTKSEMIKATNSEALYNAIHVRGGLKLWAEKMRREIGHKKIAAEIWLSGELHHLGGMCEHTRKKARNQLPKNLKPQCKWWQAE